MPKTYQTIIAGSGPAGLIAGRHLKEAIILEKKGEIGRPVQCGEVISKKALSFQRITPDNQWISSKIRQVARILPNGTSVGEFHQEKTGYVINREEFEKSLAQNTKCEIMTGAEVINIKKLLAAKGKCR